MAMLKRKVLIVKTSPFLAMALAITFGAAAHSQAVPAVKETGKAVAESTKEAGDNIKATTAKQPNKAVDKAKAHVHKAKAHVHSHAGKGRPKGSSERTVGDQRFAKRGAPPVAEASARSAVN